MKVIGTLFDKKIQSILILIKIYAENLFEETHL